MPFRPRNWFGKRCGRKNAGSESANGREAAARDGVEKRRRFWRAFLGAAVLAALAVAVSQTPIPVTEADGHGEDERWRDEIDFELKEPVPGRRIFVEGLSVTGNRAAVTLRAATGLDIRVRAFGGPEGDWLRFWGSARLAEGESIDYSLPLNGPAPSFTFSWEDDLEQAGAVTVKEAQLPYPLPAIEGELCDLRVVSLGWTPGAVEGAVDSECVTAIEEMVELPTSAGHHEETVTAVMEAEVIEITGTVTVAGGGSVSSASFVPDGETFFRLPVATGEAVHALTIDASLEATLSIPLPPLTQLTHYPKRTEYRTETVSLLRPGTTETVSRTVTVTHDDGTTTQHVVTATLSIPGETVYRDVTLTILHPERVVAEVVDREPLDRTGEEFLSMESSVGSDAPFKALVLPEPEPVEPPAEQTPAGDGLRDWFDFLGWEWPW